MAAQDLWIATLSDGLIRADQIAGIESHRTPELTGKPSRWLLDVTLAVPAGSGNGERWEIAQLHRTLAQTDAHQNGAPEKLARLLAELRGRGAAGVVRAVVRADMLTFEFTSFSGTGRSAVSPGADDDALDADE
ncbi:hypothetical protein [Saccharomonospora saliphila]|uniref:hypothetical protein n=1 Tax=Saccharomonospora saliphila TaxID=369829 RepID=UPI00037FCB35|nr:hypothetical protein [Saccharomonospora saliphila]